MSSTRTTEEWRELVRQLEALIANPNETSARKRKAHDILNNISRADPRSPAKAAILRESEDRHRTTTVLRDMDFDYDGMIV